MTTLPQSIWWDRIGRSLRYVAAISSRFQEEHVQRAHSIHEIVKLLNQTGFSAEGIYDAFTREPVRPESERIQFAAIRQEEKDNG